MKKLKNGSKGPAVKSLQICLNKAGAKPPLKLDGKFGDKTEAALKTFQKKHKLKPDGIAGEKTMQAIQPGSKTNEPGVPWPIKEDLVTLRRNLGRTYSVVVDDTRAIVKEAHKLRVHLGFADRIKELERSAKAIGKPYNNSADHLTKIMLLHEKYQNADASDKRGIDRIVADAGKAYDVYDNKIYPEFRAQAYRIHELTREFERAMKKAAAITWPFPNYDPIFKADQKKFEEIKRPMHELLSVCAKQPVPKIRKLGQESDKLFTKTEKLLKLYEDRWVKFMLLKDEFEVRFSDKVSEKALNDLVAKGKKEYVVLQKLTREFAAVIKKCQAAAKVYGQLKKQGLLSEAA